MTSQILYTFDNMALAIRDKLKLVEPPQEPWSQIGKTLTETIIVANRNLEKSLANNYEKEI
jgi:hypothetical protein